jgi:hypothetical protein
MLVSKEQPFLTAFTEAPFPKWQITRFVLKGSCPSSTAALLAV